MPFSFGGSAAVGAARAMQAAAEAEGFQAHPATDPLEDQEFLGLHFGSRRGIAKV